MITWTVIEATEGLTFVENGQSPRYWVRFTFRFNDGDAEKLAHYLNEQEQFIDEMRDELDGDWNVARARINRRKARYARELKAKETNNVNI